MQLSAVWGGRACQGTQALDQEVLSATPRLAVPLAEEAFYHLE